MKEYTLDNRNQDKVYLKKDVILAVEETIKRIEDKICACDVLHSEGEVECVTYQEALQIIKEQFNGVISNSEQKLTTETNDKQERE